LHQLFTKKSSATHATSRFSQPSIARLAADFWPGSVRWKPGYQSPCHLSKKKESFVRIDDLANSAAGCGFICGDSISHGTGVACVTPVTAQW
jgi:hypothetical protein